ncbi:MAG: hypothetical protein AABW86_02480 [Candidatus Micrarchaeota archaeon]
MHEQTSFKLLHVPESINPEYEQLIAVQARHGIGPSTIGNLWNLERKDCVLSPIKQRLSRKILVDLGCGAGESWYSMADFAKRMGAAMYIGIDKQLGKRENKATSGNFKINLASEEERHIRLPMEVFLYNGDMLDFVSRLSTGSVNFTMNNLTSLVRADSANYSTALAWEIGRATSSGGVVFGHSSTVFRHLNKGMFRQISNYAQTDDGGIFERSVHQLYS